MNTHALFWLSAGVALAVTFIAAWQLPTFFRWPLYFGAVFTVLPAIVLLERGNAISRSFQLVHADIGAALGRIVVYYGVSFLFVTVEGLLSRAITAFGTSLAVTVVATAAGIVFSLAAAVAISPMVLTAYADMRARREPFSTAYLAAPTSSDSALGDR